MKPTGWIVPALWKGDRAFIIAGGLSVAEQLPEIARIQGRILAIKHAVLLRPDAEIMFWAGADWHRENGQLITAHRGAMLVKRKVDDDVPSWIRQVERAKPDADGIAGFAGDRRRLGGLCAGGSALNLCVHLGATEIVLIGFDFGGDHWLPSYRHRTQSEDHHARHRAALERMAAPIAGRGVQVWNASHRSTLTGFARRGIDEFV